jgi:hypothetical protein
VAYLQGWAVQKDWILPRTSLKNKKITKMLTYLQNWLNIHREVKITVDEVTEELAKKSK